MLRLAASRGVNSLGTARKVGSVQRGFPGIGVIAQRYFADAPKESIKDPKPPVLPGSESKTAPGTVPPVPTLPSASAPKTVKAQVPLAPPASQAKPPKKKRRFRNFLIWVTLLTAAAYAGGTWYSLQSDNFHDFFTEYFPFAEQIVLTIQERQFRQRFPNATPKVGKENRTASVSIQKKSGVKPKVSSTSDLETTGPHMSALNATAAKKDEPAKEAPPKPKEDTSKKKIVATDSSVSPKVIKEEPAKQAKSAKDKITPKDDKQPATQALSQEKTPEKKEDKHPLHPASTEGHDPLIHDLVKIINSVITVVNQHDEKVKTKFHEAIGSAKNELGKVHEKIQDMKAKGSEATPEALKTQELEFTKVATGIVKTVDDQIGQAQEHWREEFDKERHELAEVYETKLKAELDRAREVSEQRLRAELLEQAIEMRRNWVKNLKDKIENERNGRLGKLEELNEEVKKMEELIQNWGSVLDSDLRTQKLHVAIDALRDSITDPQQPRPFIRELVAIKEISANDEVVKAAISSINPKAYQKGISSPSQLHDRFRRVSDEVRKAALLPDDAGVAGHASSWVLSHFLFKKKGLAQGADVESILTRTETYLEEGDLDNATREMNQLQGWAKTLASDWLREARILLEVRQAVDVITAQARLECLKNAGKD